MSHDHPADALSIEMMQAGDAPRITAHLTRLSADDRALRFNSALTDEAQIARYVGQMRFGEDLILGLVDASGRVVGIAHGCAFKAGAEHRIEAAFSIDIGYRGRGFGIALMRSLQAAASAQGVASIVGLCAARNRPMRRIFERAGMALTRDGDEIQACIALTAGTGWAGVAMPLPAGLPLAHRPRSL
ncbi:MAG TPA: GNAT family N-acetyltransferase [Burkholderiaceae bacterium]|nr:GNAT family N-acetyltransferase [Burkholderiaceae bacterium]